MKWGLNLCLSIWNLHDIIVLPLCPLFICQKPSGHAGFKTVKIDFLTALNQSSSQTFPPLCLLSQCINPWSFLPCVVLPIISHLFTVSVCDYSLRLPKMTSSERQSMHFGHNPGSVQWIFVDRWSREWSSNLSIQLFTFYTLLITGFIQPQRQRQSITSFGFAAFVVLLLSVAVVCWKKMLPT